MTESMSYFKKRLRLLRSEYTKPDRAAIIAAAGNKCSMCGRKNGDVFLFGPTAYLKKKIRFNAYIDIHVIEGSTFKDRNVVICNGCHISYHLINRLAEEAEFGGKTLSETIYRRCRKCNELISRGACRCCNKCKSAPKWCTCKKAKRKK